MIALTMSELIHVIVTLVTKMKTKRASVRLFVLQCELLMSFANISMYSFSASTITSCQKHRNFYIRRDLQQHQNLLCHYIHFCYHCYHNTVTTTTKTTSTGNTTAATNTSTYITRTTNINITNILLLIPEIEALTSQTYR